MDETTIQLVDLFKTLIASVPVIAVLLQQNAVWRSMMEMERQERKKAQERERNTLLRMNNFPVTEELEG